MAETKTPRLPRPAPGYAVLRVIERGRSEAGLHVVSDTETSDRFFIVYTSGVQFIMGHAQEHPAKAGDEVVVVGGTMTPIFFPEGYVLVSLGCVPVWYPQDETTH